MNYAFEYDGKAYTPEGQEPIVDVQAHNRALEAQEIEWLKTAPDKVFAYVHVGALRDPARLGSRLTDGSMARANGDDIQIRTWLGTRVSGWEVLGPRRYMGFSGAYRRFVSCKIFGVQYHGWYMESSGDYCRLKKSKKG